MHILVLADEPVQRLWGEYGLETLRAADLILSVGDLPASYLSYMTCFCPGPVVYVHGNHDDSYNRKPPEGCVCAEGHVIRADSGSGRQHALPAGLSDHVLGGGNGEPDPQAAPGAEKIRRL